MANTSTSVRLMIQQFIVDKRRLHLSVHWHPNLRTIFFDYFNYDIHFYIDMLNWGTHEHIHEFPTVNFCGQRVKLRSLFPNSQQQDSCPSYEVIQDYNDEDPPFLEMAEYLMNLFNIQIDELHYSCDYHDELLNWIPARSAKHVYFIASMPSRFIRKFLENQEDMEQFLTTGVHDEVNEIVHLSKSPVVKRLDDYDGKLLRWDILKSLKCSMLYIVKHHTLNEDGVIQFIDEWLNETDLHFQYLTIEMGTRNFDFKKVLDHFKMHLKDWNPRERAQHFQLEAHRVDCKLGRDLKRSDGRLSSIIMINDKFLFVVWKNPFPVGMESRTDGGRSARTLRKFFLQLIVAGRR